MLGKLLLVTMFLSLSLSGAKMAELDKDATHEVLGVVKGV